MTEAPPSYSLITARSRANILLSILIDALFVAGWAAITWALDRFLGLVELNSAIDTWSLKIFQWTFGITTLTPIICYTIIDLLKIIVRTYTTCRNIWKKRDEQ